MAMDNVRDPYGNYIFKLEIDSTPVGHLLDVTGLKTEAQVFEIEEGGNHGFVHKRPGGSRYENLIFKFATSGSTFLQKWRQDFLENPYDRELVKSGSITMCDNDHQPVRRYHFSSAWPVSWSGPDLDASGSALSIETLEVAHEGLTISEG
ncbi:MAG: phage tail protein [Myxococcota bacterium]